MVLFGQIIALFTSLIWTVSAMSAEVSSKRIGAMSLNVLTMFFAFIFLNITLLCLTGNPLPQYLDLKTVYWISGSGVLSYVLCNYFLFNAYIIIGSRFGQLFMTLVVPSAAIAGWLLLDERLTTQEYIGMTVTLTGIIIAILGGGNSKKDKNEGKDKEEHKIEMKLSPKGVIFAVIASISQGVGLVFGKVAMVHYHQNLPHGLTKLDNLIPISAAYIRILIGFCGFLLIAAFTKQFPAVKKSLHDRKGLWTALLTTVTGPFGGATLALVAMRYSKAGIAATLLELTPIMIILPAYLFFKQKIHILEIIGPIISVFGVSLFFIKF